jgi:hypothetical protein
MPFEQAFAAYCTALQSLIDAGASVSMSILNHVWWVRQVQFDGRMVTVKGVDSATKEDRMYSWRPD